MLNIWFTAILRVRAEKESARQNFLSQLTVDAFDAMLAHVEPEKPTAQILPFPKRGRYAA
jgi:hypothetical protein